jgi:uncharacterized pyridoxamine 5'-phosphate oxidase family protein
MYIMAENNESPKSLAFKFLQTNKSAALATVSLTGQPHVAIVYYTIDRHLNLYLVTSIESIKYHNLIAHPVVAMAISEDNPTIKKTLQLKGVASRIENINEEQLIIEKIWRKNGRSSSIPFLVIYNRGSSEELAVIKVEPYEMTISKYSSREADTNKDIFTSIIKFNQP